MDEEVFRFHMNRMAKAYSRQSFPAPRLDVIYSKMRPLEPHEFSKVCDEIIGAVTTTPNIKHFLEVAKPYLDRASKRRVDAIHAEIRTRSLACVFCQGKGCKECSCPLCEDTGVITAYRVGSVKATAPYAFRCVERKCLGKKLAGRGNAPWVGDNNGFVRVSSILGIGNSEAYFKANDIEDISSSDTQYQNVEQLVKELANKTKL